MAKKRKYPLIPAPADVGAARKATGATVEVVYEKEGLFEAKVLSVQRARDYAGDTDGSAPDEIWCTLRFCADNWEQDYPWDWVFNKKQHRLLKMPVAAVEQLCPNAELSAAASPTPPPSKRKGRAKRSQEVDPTQLNLEPDDSSYWTAEEAEEDRARPAKRARAAGPAGGRAGARSQRQQPSDSQATAGGPHGAGRRAALATQQQAQAQSERQTLRQQRSARRAEEEEEENEADTVQRPSQAPPHRQLARQPQAQTQRAGPDYSARPDPPGAPSVAGQIAGIELIDFMCHKHLAVDFKPNVNVISGENGTGKSSILQALQFGLGARANRTGRVKTAQAFVRTGQEQATVKVRVWNTGPFARRRAELGPVFTIVRTIKAAGGGSLQVLDCEGKKCAAVKGAREVDVLVDDLGIDATNPCLDQARDFAGDSSDYEKYKVFMEATQLDVVHNSLETAKESIKAQEEIVAGMHETLGKLQEQLKWVAAAPSACLAARAPTPPERRQKQELLEAQRLVSQWEGRRSVLVRLIAWRYVEELEEAKARCEEIAEREGPEKQAAAAAELAEALGRQAGVMRQVAADEERIRQLQQRAREHVEELKQVREKLKDGKKRKRDAAREAQRLEQAAAALDAQRAALMEASMQAAQELLQETQQEVDAHRRRLADGRAAAESAAAQASAAVQELREAGAAVTAAVDGLNAAWREAGGANVEVSRLQQELHALRGGQRDPVSRFGGRAAVELRRALDAAHAAGRLRAPVLGPLGSLLSLEDGSWAMAVEAAAGRLFQAWVCDSFQDRAEFQRIAQGVRQSLPAQDRGGRSLTSYIYPFALPQHRLDPSQALPASITTVMSVLRFQRRAWAAPGAVQEGPLRHVAINCMIDHAQIERTVLTRTPEKALEVVRDTQFCARHRVACVYATDGSRCHQRGLSQTFQPPQRNLRPRLVKDVEGEVQQAQTKVAALTQRVDAARAALAEAEREQARCRAARDAAAHARTQAESQLAVVQSQAPVELGPPQGGEPDAALKVAELSTRLAEARAAAEAAAGRLAEGEREVQELEARHEELRGHGMQEREEEAAEAEAAMEQGAARKAEVAQQVADAQSAETAARDGIAAARQRLGVVLAMLEQGLAQASMACSHEEAGRLRTQLVGKLVAEGRSAEDAEALLSDVQKARDEAPSAALLRRARRALPFKPGSCAGCGLQMEEQQAKLTRQIDRRQQDLGVSLAELERQASPLPHRWGAAAAPNARRERAAGRRGCSLRRRVAKLEARSGKMEVQYRRADSQVRLLQQGIRLRRQKFRAVREAAAAALSQKFAFYLRSRGHSGSVDVRYSEAELVFSVGINGKPPTSDMKSLSGGERSLSTLAFILALGQTSVSAPFLALDEFDIYMDAPARRYALGFLIEFANKNRDRQLFLLSPQDMSAVDTARKMVEKREKVPAELISVVQMQKARKD
eukprot:scaffold10.g2385.t1